LPLATVLVIYPNVWLVIELVMKRVLPRAPHRAISMLGMLRRTLLIASALLARSIAAFGDHRLINIG